MMTLKYRCRDCYLSFNHPRYGKKCPHCGSTNWVDVEQETEEAWKHKQTESK